jgi:inositol hexakisphosphate/diphosphoinositol-pentakisphosphate kinase
MLDPSGDKDAKLELDECKEKITANLQQDIDYREMSQEDRERMVGPSVLTSMHDALAEIGNPRKTLMDIHKTMGSLIEQLEEMLDLMGSGDEMRMEDGEGLKGETEEDAALSGIRLYKGETLLELTERWRFIHKRLYDPDEDKFDLSRVPDVHDNVRFDVLHNPHLGLTSTLEKLYELAKCMADVVVPQEYGTTREEKRSVGVKICSPLLQKIRDDLDIARTDNKADMRYMINMDYSADLPINTMGRRIRTRLYFTSESHLHTMLNVLRFASSDGEEILSGPGLEFINQTPELCYLTQVVFRLFEDTVRSMEDPRRFRIEILFSPGATSPPLHLDESNKGADTTRLDTARLHRVERVGLTCREIEEFFDSVILENVKNGDDKTDVESSATPPLMRDDASIRAPVQVKEVKIEKPVETTQEDMANATKNSQEIAPEDTGSAPVIASSMQVPAPANPPENESPPDQPTDEKTPVDLSSKYFWSTVAVGSLLLGAGCLAMALSLGEGRGNRRRHTIRR